MAPDRQLDAGGILGALAVGDVDYVLIGGLAVIAYGSTRVTQDMDIVPDPDPANLGRLAAVIEGLEGEMLGVEEFPEHDVRPDLDGLLAGGNFRLDTRAGGLDILQFVSGSPPYAELAAGSLEVTILGHAVRVASIDHLIRMKNAAGRPKDLEDLATLVRAAELRSGS